MTTPFTLTTPVPTLSACHADLYWAGTAKLKEMVWGGLGLLHYGVPSWLSGVVLVHVEDSHTSP